MSSKRKSEPVKKPVKRSKKKVEEDYDSDLSFDDIDDNSKQVANEVLIAGHGDLIPPKKLPEELLKTYDKDPGKLLVAGMVTWEMVGRRADSKGVTKIRPNLYSFHRFTDQTVSNL